MSASDDFKSELRQEKLDSNSIGKALKMALTELIELKITTWVVPADGVSQPTAEPKPGYRMRTRINIVDGDIDNEIGSLFLSNSSYSELREFHLGQVQESREIFQKNLESLQKLFGILVGTLKQLPQNPAPATAALPAATSEPAPEAPAE